MALPKMGLEVFVYAATSGKLPLIKALINNSQCNPQVSNSRGCQPIHSAAQFGKKHTVKYLHTQHGCDVMIPMYLITQGVYQYMLHVKVAMLK